MRIRVVSWTLALVLAIATPVIAQSLLKANDQAAASRPMPTRGMTMDQVEANFGTPTVRRSAVGDPPITRWEYDRFTVFFEYRHVVHSVPKKPAR